MAHNFISVIGEICSESENKVTSRSDVSPVVSYLSITVHMLSRRENHRRRCLSRWRKNAAAVACASDAPASIPPRFFRPRSLGIRTRGGTNLNRNGAPYGAAGFCKTAIYLHRASRNFAFGIQDCGVKTPPDSPAREREARG